MPSNQKGPKHEWRKKEKDLYLPKNKPEALSIPKLGFFVIEGQGNPNSESFGEYIAALYAPSYAVRMSPKKGMAPEGYFEYTVYPLEGVWDLTEKGRANYDGIVDKDELVFKLMIRQPDFVDADYAEQILAWTCQHKPNPLIKQVRFEYGEEGECVQMMHLGPFETEPASFDRMEAFAKEHNLIRLSKRHREIYLSDVRKVAPEKLKTVLRFQVKRASS